MNLPVASLAPFLDAVDDATLLVDRDGIVVAANGAARRLTQRTAAELLGHKLEEIAATGPNALPWIQRSMRSSGWTPGSVSIRCPDGVVVVCRGRCMRAGVGSLAVIRLVERDSDPALRRFRQLNVKIDELSKEVHRRRRAESLLESEKAVLETVASGARLEVALERLTNTVEARLPGNAIASILLLSEDGRRLHHATGPRLPQFYVDAIDGIEIGPSVGSCGTAAHSRRTVIVEDILSDPQWTEFADLAKHAKLRACWSTPILDGGRTLLGTFALYYPEPRAPTIEERALVENTAHVASIAIARHREAAARSKLLDEAQRGRAAAEATGRAKDAFIAMLGHELRNPLSAMMNAAQALAMSSLEPNARESLHRVLQRQGHHLRRILDDILDVTRIDAGKLELQNQTYALDELVAACIQDVTPHANERHIEFEVDMEPLEGFGDPTRIEQVVRNLLDNAVKYGAERGTICVSASSACGSARLIIEDDGIGIDPDFLPSVFESFSQAPQAIGRSGGGVGLGLPLVKRLVELHGGSLLVHSDGLGRGTRVEVELPLSREDASAESESPAEPPSVAEAAAVLIVEDHEDSRVALAALLEAWGYSVAAAVDGESGLDLARSAPFRVILVDIGLPGMDGYEVVQAISRLLPPPYPRIVAMSGYGQPADKQRALEAGFHAHIVKPVTIEALRQVLP